MTGAFLLIVTKLFPLLFLFLPLSLGNIFQVAVCKCVTTTLKHRCEALTLPGLSLRNLLEKRQLHKYVANGHSLASAWLGLFSPKQNNINMSLAERMLG